MDGLNSGNSLNRFINNKPMQQPDANQNAAIRNERVQIQQNALTQSETLTNEYNQYKSMHNLGNLIINNLRMNSLESMQRSSYVKNLMKFPNDMEEILNQIQTKPTNVSAQEEVMPELLSEDVSISSLASLIQKGGKDAIGKLILAMAEASKQGINDTSQLEDAIKLIKSSISAATTQGESTQVLKDFMLLYLPWLPLQQGVDFELEIEEKKKGGENSEDETILTIIITTRNFGVLKISLILSAIKTIDFVINCVDKFPKEELLGKLKADINKHSIQSNITFSESSIKPDENDFHHAKISMSQTTHVNPFLLLMANAVIRHVIELDNQS